MAKYYFRENVDYSGASMKQFIKDKNSEPPKIRQKAPSVVARLMGMDVFPMDASAVQSLKKEKSMQNGFVRYKHTPLRLHDIDLKEQKIRQLGRSMTSKKPKEEKPHKSKREFETWTRGPKESLVLDIRDKSAIHDRDSCVKCHDKVDLKPRDHQVISSSRHTGCSLRNEYRDPLRDDKTKYISSRRRSYRREHVHLPLMSLIQNPDNSPCSTRIVVLKSCLDRGKYEELSPKSEDDRDNIEHILEEVRERLKYDICGRKHLLKAEESDSSFPIHSSDPKKIAQHIAKHARESVGGEGGRNLVRSKSTRLVNWSESGSRKCRHSDGGRICSESNILDAEWRRKQTLYLIRTGKERENSWGLNDEPVQTGSFRHVPDNTQTFYADYCPKSITRSLSTPVSRTSFSKFLFEDRDLITDTQVGMKESPTLVQKRKTKKQKFNLKEKMSNFTRSFSLFGRKIDSTVEARMDEVEVLEDITSGPTVVKNSDNWNENFTEVPPTPVSLLSTASIQPDLSSTENDSILQIFRAISSDMNELQKQLKELGSDRYDNNMQSLPCGRSSLDEVHDGDEFVVHDVYSVGWHGLNNGETNALRIELANMIGGDLVEEVIKMYGQRVAEEHVG